MAPFIALVLGLFALQAYANVEVLTGDITTQNNTLEARDNDDLPKYLFADIDCYYDFVKNGNFLNYVVKIEPTGQLNDNKGWCNGIVANILGECGRSPSRRNFNTDGDFSSCNDYLTYNLHHPMTGKVIEAKGIDLNFHYEYPWEAGEDATTCITTAITKATIGGGHEFKNGGCWKRGNA